MHVQEVVGCGWGGVEGGAWPVAGKIGNAGGGLFSKNNINGASGRGRPVYDDSLSHNGEDGGGAAAAEGRAVHI